jgi:hypothetical protein
MRGVYTASFQAISISAVQDVFEVAAPSTASVRLLSIRMGQSGTADFGDAEAEGVPWNITRYATSGSGGGTVTPVAHSPGDTAFGGTVERNNTTQGGTPTVILSSVWNIQTELLWLPTPEEQIIVAPSGIIALEFPVAPADALSTCYGSITFEEIGT